MIIRALFVVSLISGFAASQNPQFCANDLARQVVDNEIKVDGQDHSRWMYREVAEKQNSPKQISEIVETNDGNLETPLLIDGHAPSVDDQRRADQHIQQLTHDPSQGERSRKERKQDQERTDRMFRMLPDAFNYSYAEQRGDLVKMNFAPNPQFHPPTREAEVFAALEGFMWVDQKQKRLVEISGRLVRKVKFGGGLLGHLDQGGTFDVKKEQVAPGIWKLTLLKVNMTGRVLFFKNISEQQQESRNDFRRLPDNLTMAQAADLLQRQVIAQTRGTVQLNPALVNTRTR